MGGKLEEQRWDKEILQTFIAHKSLAVVIGVGALLLIQVGYTIPFFTSTTIFAPFWMGIIGLLIVAFLAFDGLAHRIYTHHYLHLGLGVLALVSLLIVPAIFVAVLVSTENTQHWTTFIANRYHLSGPLFAHWLLRYLHILGAGVVFAGVFHYLYSTRDADTAARRTVLLKWVVAGLLFQIVVGVFLYGSVPHRIDAIIKVFFAIGIVAALTLLWVGFSRTASGLPMRAGALIGLAFTILIPMLIGRQFLQYKGIKPLHREVMTAAAGYERSLRSYRGQVLNGYSDKLGVVYDDGATIYDKSCAFCHGSHGLGKGPETNELVVPPEALAEVRTSHDHLYRILVDGVDGTAMPYFAYFDRGKLDDLIRYLDERFHMLGQLSPVPATVSQQAEEEAHQVFKRVCSTCHGPSGEVAPFTLGYEPPPTDFAVYNPQPKRAFDIITNGYPGTMMVNYDQLPEEVRWGLVKMVNGMFRPTPTPAKPGG